MDEPAAAAPAPEQPIRYSLRQIIAVMTAVGASIALFFTLVSPPLGSSGLSWAMLPASVLAGAIWFLSDDTSARLATYAVVASLFSLAFGAIAFSQSDWLFGHGLGTPQLTVASFISTLVGALTGGVWIMSKFAAQQQASPSDSVADGGKSPPAHWRGAVVIVPLTLLSCLSVLGGLSSLPRTMQRLDLYIRQQQLQAETIAGMRARAIDRAHEAERRQLRDALLREMASTDEVARYQAAATLLADSVSEDREHRMMAVKILGTPPTGADTAKAVRGLQRVLSDAPPEDPSRREALRSLGRIGPAAAPAVPRLGLTVFSESTDADERGEAVSSLAAMGPAAKGAAHFIGGAWREHRITLEQAQLLYKIDPAAAESFQIPRDAAAAAKLQKLNREEDPLIRREGSTTAPHSTDRGLQAGRADDPEQLVALVRSLNDDDPIIRQEVVTALSPAFRFPMRFRALPPSVVGDLIAATKRPETRVSASALAVLRYMGPAAAEAVPTLLEITKNPPSPPDRVQAIYALGQIGAAAVEAVPRLSQILTTDIEPIEPHERSAATKALGLIGKAAKPAVPAFREALEKHLITSEDAEALYHIDPKAAEELKVPRRQAGR